MRLHDKSFSNLTLRSLSGSGPQIPAVELTVYLARRNLSAETPSATLSPTEPSNETG
jgi:hypothetical protein